MNRSVKKLSVNYNGRLVGFLAEIDDQKIAFQYDSEWLETGFSISPFSLPLSDKVFVNQKKTFGGLYGVFQDSLPDGWGELLVRRMLAKSGINFERLSPLTKLSLVSANGLGALEFTPSQSIVDESSGVDLDIISDEIKKIYDNDQTDNDLDRMFCLGGSSGGARPKAHICDASGHWIVKFPCSSDPVDIGKKEFDANESARNCNININVFKLFPSKTCSGYFGAKRFDREGDKRVHMVSLASLLETTHRVPNLDYMHLFQVITKICVDKSDLDEAFRRMCFNVYYCNRDDHGKNFAFLYDEKICGYKLSPAYDITKTIHKLEHEMTVNGNGMPLEIDLLEVGKMLKLPVSECRATIDNTRSRCI